MISVSTKHELSPESKSRRSLVGTALLALLASCGSVPDRNPLPGELADLAVIPGFPDVRNWGDEQHPHTARWLATPDEVLQAQYAGISGVEHHYLAISGGGANGAYGAGLMVGWTEKGDRPEFTIVSGISTGALAAPFVFLGPDYDDRLEEIYTSYSTEDLAEERSTLKGLTSDAMAGSEPLRGLIAKYMDEELLEAIAVEHRKGRVLLIGTTNLDAMRPVVWSIGKIATSGHPRALELFHDILVASTALPIAFPPVLFEVEAEGQRYDELHVDGGVTTQVFLIPTQLDWDAVLEKLNVPGRPTVYVLRNGMLDPRWKTIEPSVLGLAGRTLDSLIRTQGLGDVARIFLDTLEEGMDYNLTFIPDDFDLEPTEPFDREYMQALFKVGRERALHGEPWQSHPPGFEHLGDEQGGLRW
jgi:hypothetical protein